MPIATGSNIWTVPVVISVMAEFLSMPLSLAAAPVPTGGAAVAMEPAGLTPAALSPVFPLVLASAADAPPLLPVVDSGAAQRAADQTAQSLPPVNGGGNKLPSGNILPVTLLLGNLVTDDPRHVTANPAPSAGDGPSGSPEQGQEQSADAMIPAFPGLGEPLQLTIDKEKAGQPDSPARPFVAVPRQTVIQQEASARLANLNTVIMENNDASQPDQMPLVQPLIGDDGNLVAGRPGLAGFVPLPRPEHTKTVNVESLISQIADMESGSERGLLASGMQSGETRGTVNLTTTLQLSTDNPLWSRSLGERVVWMLNQNMQSARIHLNPPELGPVEMHVAVKHEQVAISFVVHHGLTRELLENALPQLRDMLSDNGMNLGQTQFSDRPASDGQRAAHDSATHQSGRSSSQNSSVGENDDDQTVTRKHVVMSLIDDYA